jgi:hypothetical protein
VPPWLPGVYWLSLTTGGALVLPGIGLYRTAFGGPTDVAPTWLGLDLVGWAVALLAAFLSGVALAAQATERWEDHRYASEPLPEALYGPFLLAYLPARVVAGAGGSPLAVGQRVAFLPTPDPYTSWRTVAERISPTKVVEPTTSTRLPRRSPDTS